MKVFLRIVLILFLVAGIAGGIWYYRNQSAAAQGSSGTSGAYRQVVAAQRGDLSSSITVVGQLDAAQTVELAFERLSGSTVLRTLDVAAGNTVKKGDALATVDPAPYQQAVDEAKSNLQSAEAALADLQTPATELEIRQADLALAQARQQLEQAKADLADLQQPDSDTLRTLKNAVVNAQDALALARLDNTLAENGSTAKSVRDLQYSVGWHDRKLNEYQQLVSAGKANKEQTEAVATEQEALSEARASLANVEAQHRLALRTAAATVTAAEVALADAQATRPQGGRGRADRGPGRALRSRQGR